MHDAMDVFELDMEKELFPVYGIISQLPDYKMCSIVSKITGIELMHELAISDKERSIKLTIDGKRVYFDKFLYVNKEEKQSIELICNKSKLIKHTPTKQTNLLFENEPDIRNVVLLEEWQNVDYILKTEGDFIPLDINKLKKAEGIQMVLEEHIEFFKNYERILQYDDKKK